ncbi:tRNA (guanine-N(7)-)-methyltransferase non-catalytic subunit trm82 [Lodderomyces elongisporus]|uniref:tRNA (guanine-N(7)-)-methyltransferase non-catalytic subunit trm82 n=1 Tax=Lodderomyces elongisporus TaxID=36914 RepID=UPI002921A06F|nr:tRNA (guanine-N(7)-)-methyltransferase non-catalytic subunit trm82 [Lodderomyces elongisporus]WLF81434.1 tRNA (guanine-N(7)-)-methyltransferase non-catalytic subunit trm82 [Lodderomyces elongisporus]
MKHPFQILTSSTDGKLLIASASSPSNESSLLLLSPESGDVLCQQNVPQPIYINYSETGPDKVLITADVDKNITIYKLENNELHQLKQQPMPKRLSGISILNSDAIVCDSLGDVYQITIDTQPAVKKEDLKPLLGHTSPLTAVVAAQYKNPPKSFLITSDRDEHIRVSNYPKSYVIKGFLYGHTQFVSQIHLFEICKESRLVSGGGEGKLFFWDWFREVLITEFDLMPYVEEYLHEFHIKKSSKTKEEQDVQKEQEVENIQPKYEIGVQKIDSIEGEDGVFIVTLVENTSCLVVVHFTDEAKHAQTIQLAAPAVTFAIVGNKLFVSLDAENDNILTIYKFVDGQFVNDDEAQSSIAERIISANPINVEDKSKFAPFYSINQLRKRGNNYS